MARERHPMFVQWNCPYCKLPFDMTRYRDPNTGADINYDKTTMSPYGPFRITTTHGGASDCPLRGKTLKISLPTVVIDY